MSRPARVEARESPDEADVDALLYEFKNDAREAIRALLHDLAVLAEDYAASTSAGYVRGRGYTLALRRAVGHRGDAAGQGGAPSSP